MPELTTVHFAAFAILFGIGAVVGWLLRGDRSARERIAVNAGWQEQFEAQQSETRRMTEQNKGLMQQIHQHQASGKDLERRVRELADSLREATEHRDQLRRRIKEIRGELEFAIKQRNQLRTDIRSRDMRNDASASALREKDNKIFKLSRELSSWQSRVPPLVEKYRQRELEMKELQFELEHARARTREIDDLQEELARANDRLAELDLRSPPEHTRIEPIDSGALGDRLDACNEQFSDTAESDCSDLQDQIDDDLPRPAAGNGRYGLDFASESAQAPDRPVSSTEPAVSGPSSDGEGYRPHDDLQQIKGVGPAIERTLNTLGFYRFEQIASISEIDIERIAAHMRGFRSRIYREDWIGQARSLQSRNESAPRP